MGIPQKVMKLMQRVTAELRNDYSSDEISEGYKVAQKFISKSKVFKDEDKNVLLQILEEVMKDVNKK